MIKTHYSTVRSMKNCAVLTEDGAFALFFCPHPGGFDSSRVPIPGDLPTKAKKMLMPEFSPGGGGEWLQLELTDALKLICFADKLLDDAFLVLWKILACNNKNNNFISVCPRLIVHVITYY